jgi:phage/plasmid-associated DNA primase
VQKESEYYKAFIKFLSNRQVNGTNFNFNDQRENKKYYVKEADRPELFRILEDCRKNGIVTGLSVCQYPQDLNMGNGVVESGLCIDIDLKQKVENKQWNHDDLRILIEGLDQIIRDIKYLVMCRDSIEAEKDYYKDGLHIYVLELVFPKAFKQHITSKLRESTYVNACFHSQEYIHHSAEVDPCMPSNNLLLYGCARPGKKPYKYLYIRKVSHNNYTTDDDFGAPSTNFVQEFNIVYDGVVFKRTPVSIKADWESNLHTIYAEYEEEDKASRNIADTDDPDYNTASELIDILSVERSTQFNTWRTIITALGVMSRSSSCNYKLLAIKFSAKCPEKWRLNDAKAKLNEIWNWARSSAKIKAGMAVLRRAAKEDNPEVYARLKKSIPLAMLTNALNKNEGTLPDHDLASVLFTMYSSKFYYDPSNRKWYEFISKTRRSIEDYHLYKFVDMDEPDALHLYIPKAIPEFLEDIIQYFEDQLKQLTTTQNADEQYSTWYKKMIKNTKRTITTLKNTGKVNSTICACRLSFTYHNFHEQLDKDPYIVGIGNGVLELSSKQDSPKVKLITEKHPYKISTFTKVPYLADGMEKKVAYIKDKWDSTFKEPDVRRWMLYHMSTCLKGTLDYLKLMIWHGPGEDGKSTWMVFLAETLGGDKGYAYKLPSQYYTTAPGLANEHTAHLVGVKKARYIYSSEFRPTDNFYTDRLKMLLSGEQLANRAAYGQQDNFYSAAKPFVASQFVPRLVGDLSHGATRRILTYRMKHTFRTHPEGPDQMLADTDFQNKHIHNIEYQKAFLQILVHAYEELMEEFGGRIENVPCQTIADETKTYIEGQDYVTKFVNNKMVASQGNKISLDDASKEYIHWFTYSINKKGGRELDGGTVQSLFMHSSIRNNIRADSSGMMYIMDMVIKDAQLH